MLTITLTSANLPQAIAKLNLIASRLSSPQKGLERATHGVADIFAKNFDEEGSEVGGWAPLSEYASSVRFWQGLPTDHPILVRYGSLRAMAVAFFQKASIGDSAAAGADTTDFSWSDQEVTGRLDYSGGSAGGTATLVLGGSYKILNQWGYSNTNGSGDLPPRPFWFVNENVRTAARQGVIDWIKDEVL